MFCSRFNSWFCRDCWFFVDNGVSFEICDNIRVWEGSTVGFKIVIESKFFLVAKHV